MTQGPPAPVPAVPPVPPARHVPHGPQGPPDAPEPRTYPQLLRGPRHRGWKPLVSLVTVLGLLLVVVVVLVVVSVVGLLVSGLDPAALDDPEVLASPALLLANNLLLAAGIPVAMVAVWVGHGWRPRWVASVVGGIRWRWLLLTSAVALAVQVVATIGLFVVTGFPQGQGSQVLLLLAVVLLTTPLQAAGEEYFFRGWMTQTIGSWFRGALLAAIVPAVVTGLLFAAAHGGQNLWLFADRLAFGLVASYLTWRTGGLEAAIGAHAVNNLVVFVPVILSGTLADSLLVSEAPWELVLLDLVVMAAVAGFVVLLARRLGIQRRHDPARQPGGRPPQPVLVAPAPWG